jgi:hypothetical protein
LPQVLSLISSETGGALAADTGDFIGTDAAQLSVLLIPSFFFFFFFLFSLQNLKKISFFKYTLSLFGETPF